MTTPLLLLTALSFEWEDTVSHLILRVIFAFRIRPSFVRLNGAIRTNKGNYIRFFQNNYLQMDRNLSFCNNKNKLDDYALELYSQIIFLFLD